MEVGCDWGRGDRREEGSLGALGARGALWPWRVVVSPLVHMTAADRVWFGNSTKTNCLLAFGVTPCPPPAIRLSFLPLSAFCSSKHGSFQPPNSSRQQQGWERGWEIDIVWRHSGAGLPRIQCQLDYFLLGICFVAHIFPGIFIHMVSFHFMK